MARNVQITQNNKFAKTLWYSEILHFGQGKARDLNALAGSNTTITIFYTFNVLPPLTLFLFQYGIYTKSFLAIDCET